MQVETDYRRLLAGSSRDLSLFVLAGCLHLPHREPMASAYRAPVPVTMIAAVRSIISMSSHTE